MTHTITFADSTQYTTNESNVNKAVIKAVNYRLSMNMLSIPIKIENNNREYSIKVETKYYLKRENKRNKNSNRLISHFKRLYRNIFYWGRICLRRT